MRFLIGSLVVIFCAASSHGAIPNSELIRALIQVESRGNDQAIGDTHLKQHAYGCLQIRQTVCDDVNRRFGTNYQAKQCLGDRELSVELCKLYIDMYATPKRVKHTPTPEDMARIWNGGPRGWHKKSTQAYWERVRAELERVSQD